MRTNSGPNDSTSLASIVALTRVFARSIQFLGGAVVLVALTYLFGHALLEGSLGGNDSGWALTLANWYNRWFPQIPIWFPMQGAGTPLTVLHPPSSSLSVVLLHRVSGLTIIQSFKFLGILSVALTVVGIFALVWRGVRSWSAGLLAGILYLVSSASWNWLANVGLYAQATSIFLVPWSLLCLDIYLRPYSKRSNERLTMSGRLALIAGAILLGLSFTFHASTGVSLVMSISLYVILVPLILKSDEKIGDRIRRSIGRGALFLVSGVAIGAFWLLPLAIGNGLSNREGLSYVAAHNVSAYDPLATLSITVPPHQSYIMTFAVPVVLLAVVGLAFGLVKRSIALVWALLGIAFLAFVSMPIYSPEVVEAFEFLWSRLLDRPILISVVLIPAVASYGAYSLVKLLFSLPELTLKAFPTDLSHTLGNAYKRFAKPIFVAIGTLFVGAAFLAFFDSIELERVGYGPPSLQGKLPIAYSAGEIEIRNQPKFEINDEGIGNYQSLFSSISDSVDLTKIARLDVSPNLGGVTQNLNLFSDASMVNIYSYQISIIHAMWGYQQGLFFGSTEASNNQLSELSKWFGISHVLLHRDLDRTDKYDPSIWTKVYPEDPDIGGFLDIRQFNDQKSILGLTEAPRILVIGGYENGVYEQVFKTFTSAGIGIDQAILVEGVHDIDSYSLADLKLFDAVLLHGYGYQNQKAAWDLLGRYVEEGGSLITNAYHGAG